MGKLKRVVLLVLACEVLVGASQAFAGGKIAIDDTKWVSLGAGGRFSFAAREEAAPNGDDWSKDFNVDNTRIYLNGQVHKYLKLEVNTDCVFCGNSSLEEFALLDAIAKVELSPYFNIWAGRLLVPAERREMNGPFYGNTYDSFKTPFYPSDFSVDFGTGGAGVYGRDQGVNIWGAWEKFQYVFGIFQGLQSSGNFGPNQSDNPLFGMRLAYNFLTKEDNPGYYTSGTYYGTGGDILTLGFALQHQDDGTGSMANPGDFTGVSADLLFEMPFENLGVLTFDGEYKHFDSDYSTAAFADADVFPMFDGDSFSLVALYLFPQTIGIGQFQPYARYTGVYPDDSTDRDEFEFGLNYVVSGHNARVSLFFQHGDIATKGLNYAPGAPGDDVSAIKLGIQLQI